MPSNSCRPGSDTTAAPAAVFPSVAPNWRRLDYLARGNPRQRSAHALLGDGLWDELGPLCSDLALVSTVAIGLDRPGSDLDILCQYPKPASLAATLAAQGWQVRSKGEQVWIAEQTRRGPDGQSWPLELYITSASLERLHGWRHLSLMAALLAHFGEPFHQEVRRLRLEDGLKGEAAICRLLGLSGDPYTALLTLEGRSLAGLCWSPSPLVRPAQDDAPPCARTEDS
ncbi:DUF4269 domain-containing protein [Aeromonas taiwanensis]|uniref:DUF4269 domain-containing protein n=1 Tax=Aeromonas taiwanensis TaxID=633417 RepID=UPI00207CDD2E|nr:DUF4269 domain-containing protein [Aeromonas taiwanensis]MCO4206249.1 DUF4269 domain-containing protein [Aeromonas taiwanensis]